MPTTRSMSRRSDSWIEASDLTTDAESFIQGNSSQYLPSGWRNHTSEAVGIAKTFLEGEGSRDVNPQKAHEIKTSLGRHEHAVYTVRLSTNMGPDTLQRQTTLDVSGHYACYDQKRCWKRLEAEHELVTSAMSHLKEKDFLNRKITLTYL